MMISDPIISIQNGMNIPPTVVAGRRTSARVYADKLALDNISSSPTEAFRHIQMEPIGATIETTRIYANRVVTILRDANGGTITWTTFASVKEPWMAVIIDRTASLVEGTLEVMLSCSSNVDYIHKFVPTGKQNYVWSDNQLNVTCIDHPEISATILTSGSLEPVGPSLGEFSPKQDLVAKLCFTDPKAFIVCGAGETNALSQCLAQLDLIKIQSELSDIISIEEDFLNSGAQLETPDDELNRFFHLSRIWFHKNVRILPFGPPFSTDAQANAEIEVLTASGDYHGVFANDNVQTAVEGMIAAPSLKTVYENDLDVLFSHSANCDGYLPEAVEFLFGNQEVFIQGLKIGQHPEWIVSLASVVLLSGDRQLGERLWPGVELALQFFVDENGDGVNEWDTAAYPEQPNTTGYRSGMLYAQAWWVWAFDRAAELSAFLGKVEESENLRQRRAAALEAMERVFSRPDGYGVWLSQEGKLHPHQGHCAIIPVALGLCTQDRADRIIATTLSSDIWMDPCGPLRANRGSEIKGGDRVWAFMRWQFVQALLMADKPELAIEHAGFWARQELENGLLASESFPTPITGITGQGYVWTAGRAIRALSYGLFGLNPVADGISVSPHMPANWDHMALKSLPFRGKTIDIEVTAGPLNSVTLNDKNLSDAIVRDCDLDPVNNLLRIMIGRQ